MRLEAPFVFFSGLDSEWHGHAMPTLDGLYAQPNPDDVGLFGQELGSFLWQQGIEVLVGPHLVCSTGLDPVFQAQVIRQWVLGLKNVGIRWMPHLPLPIHGKAWRQAMNQELLLIAHLSEFLDGLYLSQSAPLQAEFLEAIFHTDIYSSGEERAIVTGNGSFPFAKARHICRQALTLLRDPEHLPLAKARVWDPYGHLPGLGEYLPPGRTLLTVDEAVMGADVEVYTKLSTAPLSLRKSTQIAMDGQGAARTELLLLALEEGIFPGRLWLDLNQIATTWYGTEDPNPRSRHFATAPISEAIAMFLREEKKGLEAIEAIIPELSKGVGLVTKTLAQGGNIYYLGAGSAGRAGILDAAEIPPTFGLKGRFIPLMAGGDSALVQAKENAEDDEVAGGERVSNLSSLDLLVAISAHGGTPYVQGALKKAREMGITTITIVNNPGTPVGHLADLELAPLTGAEVLLGSTRLKAGTSEKVILNVLSTLGVARLGGVVDHYMVNFVAGNEKLQDRALRIVMHAKGLSRRLAKGRLSLKNGRVADVLNEERR